MDGAGVAGRFCPGYGASCGKPIPRSAELCGVCLTKMYGSDQVSAWALQGIGELNHWLERQTAFQEWCDSHDRTC